jgi:hypothetical protein
VSASYFRQIDTGFEPEARAHAPWGEDMLHGRLLGGIAARSIENEYASEGWRVARLTIDLFRPAGMTTVRVRSRPVRRGRRVQVVDAELRCGGHEVGRATAVILAESEQPPGSIWRPERFVWPDPESLDDALDANGEPIDSEWLFRTVSGGFDTGEQSRVWRNDNLALVDDEPMSPFVRAAVSGDIACPLANSSDRGLYYINADYTMLLARYPVGPWVGVEVSDQMEADGISIGSAILVDQLGPFATSAGTSLARPPLAMGS